MTDLLNDVDSPSDAELISSVRGGDVAAYGELFSRHKDAANRLARQLVRGPDSDDLVSEAFAKVLTVLQGGGGPDVAFRAYLLTAVRRLHVDRVRVNQRLQTTDDMTPFDPGVPFKDTAVAGFESGAAAKAFASLPERWQLVLWHLEVEGQKPADIAPLLGMSANSVSALAYRAREGLRQAFLTMHLSDISETDCRWVNEHLGAFVRKGLSKRDSGKVQGHLDECRRCTAMYLELADVNSNLSGIIAPLLLGAAATGYLASSGAGMGAAGLLSGVLGRARDVALANTGAVAAGAVASGVAAAAVATVVVTHIGAQERPNVVADPPAGLTSSAPVSPGAAGPSGTAGASGSTSPSDEAATPTLSASPSASLSPSPLLLSPTVTPTESPTALLPLEPSVDPSVAPSELPSDPPTDAPSTEAPPAPAPPSVSALSVDSSGTVTVDVTGVGLGDTVGITIQSAQTTYDDPLAVDGCTRDDDRHVTCLPTGTGGVEAALAAVGDYGVTLPLRFPASMVEDDVQVAVTVNGGALGDPASRTFHPQRTPTFDFSVGGLTESSHTVADTDDDGVADVDRYTLATTASLPSRVRGLVYRIAGAARFRTVDGDGCTVSGDESRVLTCAGVADGDPVTLSVATDALREPTDVSLTVSPVDTFDDPDPTNDSAGATLTPGADLSLPGLSVFSADPDGLVTLRGRLAGVRPGMGGATYHLLGGATFPDGRNPGCAPDDEGATLVCDTAADGDLELVIRATEPDAASDVTIGAYPRAPFVSAGTGHTTTLTLPGRAVHDFSLGGLAVATGGHTVDGDTDTYLLRGTVGDLPSDVDALDFTVSGATVAATQQDPRCSAATVPGPDGDEPGIRCTGLTDDPGVTFTVSSSSAQQHAVTVTALPPDRYDDPGPAANDDTVQVSPGTELSLDASGGPLTRADDGTYRLPVHLGGTRSDLDAVRLTLDGAATFGAAPEGCTAVDDDTLRCGDPVDGDLTLVLRATDPAHATDVTVTATPTGEFRQLSDGNAVSRSLRASYDFGMGELSRVSRSLVDGHDHYTLRSSIDGIPSGSGPLTFRVTGGTFAGTQDSDCAVVDGDDHAIVCGQVGSDGRTVDLGVDTSGSSTHDVGIALVIPDGYDDDDAANDSRSISLAPAVDLHLANLDPDNESPNNDDDLHLVTTRLTGVRAGVDTVSYTLTGDATFVRSDAQGCTLDGGRTLVCTDPGAGDGTITFTVRADDVRTSTRISISAEADDPFVELDDADNADGVTLQPRPTYDFAMGALSATAHSVDGDTDHYTLRSTVQAVPDGVAGLTFAVTGGTFSSGQDAGCTRVDSTHVTCTGLDAARDVDFGVDSTSPDQHGITVSLQLPRRYDDPDASNDSDTVTVTPGVDLALGALTPGDPVPAANGTYAVATTLTGARGGAVRLAVRGASVTDSSCAVTSGSVVTCTDPSDAQRVTLTLRPASAGNATPVTVTAQPTGDLTELTPGDNDASTTLAPDVVLGSLTVRSDAGPTATVRAQVSGIPSGTSSLLVRIGGADAGTGPTQVHLTNGAAGADGQGDVDCATSDAGGRTVADGLFATCTKLDRDADGAFYIDLVLAHPHGRSSDVLISLEAAGVDEGAHDASNSRALTLG